MKKKVKYMVRTILAYSVVAALFIFTLIDSLRKGEGVGTAIFSAAFVTICIILIIGILFFLWWRLCTPSGRKAEEEAQARYYIKKLDKKRSKEWREMNR